MGHRRILAAWLGFGILLVAGWIAFPLPAAQAVVRDGQVSAAGRATEAPKPDVSSSSVAVVVDGERNPELISDTLAYRHFLMAIAEGDEPTPEDIERREAFLVRVGLSKADQFALLVAFRNVRNELIQSDREFQDTASDSVRSALRTHTDQVLDSAWVRADDSLSIEGRAALDRYIKEHVKRRIKIYGDR